MKINIYNLEDDTADVETYSKPKYVVIDGV
jgi:hypothetical protein